MMEHNSEIIDQPKTYPIRKIGIGVFLSGLCGVGFFIIWPLYQVSKGVLDVNYSRIMSMSAIMMTLAGIHLILFGINAVRWSMPDGADIREITLQQWIFGIINFAIVVAVSMYVSDLLTAMGYEGPT